MGCRICINKMAGNHGAFNFFIFKAERNNVFVTVLKFELCKVNCMTQDSWRCSSLEPSCSKAQTHKTFGKTKCAALTYSSPLPNGTQITIPDLARVSKTLNRIIISQFYIINNVANDKRVIFSTKSNKNIIAYQLIFFVQFFNIILTVSSADISFEMTFSLSNPSKSFSFHQRFISCSL